MPALLRPDHQDSDRLERSRRIGWIDTDAVVGARCLVIGAGALGNEVVKNLVLSGVMNLTLVDMDAVVLSNLNRCVFFRAEDALEKRDKAPIVARRAADLNDAAKIDFVVGKVQDLPTQRFKEHDLVFGCLDNVAARLHANSHSYFHGVPYIDGATLGTSGKVQTVIPPSTPCLQCAMNRTHYRLMEKRFSCTGNDVTFFEPKMAAEITTTSIVAAVQVREGLKILSGEMERCIKHVWYYDGLANRSEILEVDVDPECSVHAK
ncbi:MAG: ThiF family adenylyltransferase [Methanomassiliicoccales archaeon]|nr:ThiF family adenylyltransferase [Methanomassiliicoccales archaeon]